MDTWLIPFEFLDPTQKEAVADLKNKNSIVVGPPGSGKTQVLLHRAAFLKEKYALSPEKFRVFVFTNSLKNFIKPELDLLGLDEENISTFDSWCYKYFKENVAKTTPWNKKERVPDFKKIREQVLEKIKKKKEGKIFSFLVVDEAQDFSSEVIEILTLITENLTLAFDSRQRIYENGSSLQNIKGTLKNDNVYYLQSGYRCSEPIKDVASILLENPSEKTNFEREYSRIEGPVEKPLLFLAADWSATG